MRTTIPYLVEILLGEDGLLILYLEYQQQHRLELGYQSSADLGSDSSLPGADTFQLSYMVEDSKSLTALVMSLTTR